MKDMPAAQKAGARRPAVRCGRPPRELEGEVEERILNAARKVFLERGFEGASIEEIAETARAGKPTIYTRFPNKQALFAAALMRHVIDRNARLQKHAPVGTTIEERLGSLGVALLNETLTDESVGMIRLGIAESRNFPEIGSSVAKNARERATETIARLMEEITLADGPGISGRCSQDCSTRAARYFIDLVLLPLMMRALTGETLETVRAEIGSHVSQRVPFFMAACRHGGIV